RSSDRRASVPGPSRLVLDRAAAPATRFLSARQLRLPPAAARPGFPPWCGPTGRVRAAAAPGGAFRAPAPPTRRRLSIHWPPPASWRRPPPAAAGSGRSAPASACHVTAARGDARLLRLLRRAIAGPHHHRTNSVRWTPCAAAALLPAAGGV